jgi:hypothetical protein
MIVLDSSADQIILDTRDIDVDSVVFVGANGDIQIATFNMGESDDVLGTPLINSVPTASRALFIITKGSSFWSFSRKALVANGLIRLF